MVAKMKNVGVARIIARTNVGGPSLQVTALMRGLDRERFSQTLLRGSVDVGEADYLALRAPDVMSIDVPGLGRSVRPLDDLRALWFLTRWLRLERPLIVHTHTAKAGTLGRIAAVIARVPIRVHTFHGHVLHGYFSPTVTRLIVLLERVLGRMTTYAAVVGEDVRADLVAARIVRLDRSRVIAPGVAQPPARDRLEARVALGVDSGGLVVAFIGRLTGIKRTERFVDLARALQGSCPDVMFLIVGDGPEREKLESRADGLSQLVFAGWRADMAEVYAATDLVVLTSDNEGMPVALIEAAMHGIPAVATEVGSVGRVVENGSTGVLTAVGDQPALENAVRDLLADDLRRRRMGEAASLRAAELFSEARLVNDYATLYADLIDRRDVRR
jgi:glycosyltransferase involved in cell wall biosynthesis